LFINWSRPRKTPQAFFGGTGEINFTYARAPVLEKQMAQAAAPNYCDFRFFPPIALIEPQPMDLIIER